MKARRAARLQARGQAPQRRGRRRHAEHVEPSALKGNGILGKKVAFVTGDTQTKADAARASAKRMIENDGVIMITGGSSSAEAIARAVPLPGDGHHLHGRPDATPTTPPARTGAATASATSSTPTCRAGARAGARQGLWQGPPRLSPDRRLHLGLDAGGVDQGRAPRRWAGRPSTTCSRRSARRLLASTSPRS